MTDKEKIHQILSSLWKNDDSVGKTYYNQALQDVQTAIDLQEEPVSDDLENEVIKKILYFSENFHKAPWAIDSTGAVMPIWYAKFGANWKKEQMMAKAVDGTARPYDNEIWCILDSFNLEDGDKVKVIIIKED